MEYEGQRAPRRGTLARAMEARETTKRAAEAARGEIQRYYADQKVIDTTSGNQLKDAMKRREREFRERQSEAAMLESVYQNERSRQLGAIRSEEEERLASVLVKREQEKERSAKEMQQLREQSEELRELAEKLRVARMNKGRSEQLVERKVLAGQAAAYDAAMNDYVARSDQAAQAAAAEAEADRRGANVAARLVLEEQMAEKQDALKLADAEAARERAMVDEVLRRIAEEDHAEVTLKRAKAEETKAFIAGFLLAQDARRRAEAEGAAAEDRKIAEYWTMVKDRETAAADRQAARREVADRMYEKVKAEMEEQARLREEEEGLINLLQQEELEAKRRAEDAARVHRIEAMRAEMIRANEVQMRLKEEREAVQRSEEEAFRLRMMAKFAEDDRLEQLNAAKRRLKTAEHQRAVGAMIDERRRMFEEQRARDEAELAAWRDEEMRKAGLVEEERRRMLAEAAELHEYLPKGVMRHQGDVDYVNALRAQAATGRA